MKKNKILLVICISISSFFTNCTNSKNDTCKWDAMPNSSILRITKSGIVVPDNILLNIKLSYYENSTKKYVSDFTIGNIDLNIRGNGYISSREIGFISANKNIKDYYIEYPNGWQTDTIYVDYLPNTLETNCQYVLRPIKVNDVLATVYSTIDFNLTVYEVNKP